MANILFWIALVLIVIVTLLIGKKKDVNKKYVSNINCIIIGVLLLIPPVFILLMGISVYGWRPVSRLRAMLPEIREDFVAVRPRLDILRGEFARNSLSVSVMSWGVSYSDWRTIEWLSEEREAIVFLLFSDEITHNYTSIWSERARGDEMWASIDFGIRGAELVVVNSADERPHFRYRVRHEEEMGGGYVLVIRQNAITSGLAMIGMGVGGVLMIPALLLLYLGIFRTSVKRLDN